MMKNSLNPPRDIRTQAAAAAEQSAKALSAEAAQWRELRSADDTKAQQVGCVVFFLFCFVLRVVVRKMLLIDCYYLKVDIYTVYIYNFYTVHSDLN